MKNNNSFILGITLLFLYLIFTELILPPTKYLPSPELLYDSFVSLISNYSLIARTGEFLLWTYLPAFLIVLLFYFLRTPILKIFTLFMNSYRSLNMFFFVPILGAVIYLALLVKDLTVSEIIISVFVISGGLKYLIAKLLLELDNTYVNAAKGLGINNNKVFAEVISKQIMPKIKNQLINAHILFLNGILLVEVILRSNLGGLFFDLLYFKDVTGVFTVTVFVAVLFGVNQYLLKLILNKIVYWE